MSPFENSLPLVLACVALAAISIYAWLKTQTSPWIIIAALAACTALAAIVADRLIETDREHIEAFFHRLAAAAERQDIDTILAALDPDLRSLRDNAERVLKQVKPTEVTITKLDVTLDSPEAASVDLIVRVSGNVVGEGTPGTVLVGLRVQMVKKGGTWLVTDADVEPGRPGR